MNESFQKGWEEFVKGYPEDNWAQWFKEPRVYEEDPGVALFAAEHQRLPWWALWRRFKNWRLRTKLSEYSHETVTIDFIGG